MNRSKPQDFQSFFKLDPRVRLTLCLRYDFQFTTNEIEDITGMTRYACFWVENGEIIAPIANLRFDESLYRFWSAENLIDLTNFQEFIPEVGTYESRQLGGSLVPGMLVKNFTYTL
jgi:predicted Zn-dependent protease